MLAQLLSIQIRSRPVVRRAKIDEDPRTLALAVVELPPVPDRPFIKHQRLALRIPISRHIQHRRQIETVFHKIAFILRLRIAKKFLLAVIERIYNHVPRPVQTYRGPSRNVLNQISRSDCSSCTTDQQ